MKTSIYVNQLYPYKEEDILECIIPRETVRSLITIISSKYELQLLQYFRFSLLSQHICGPQQFVLMDSVYL